MSKVTIEDISRQTGLSRGTVSRALNDRPDISHQTKQKVLDACRQLNYVPSHAARSLATGRSLAVAVLVDDLCSGFAACFLRGVLRRAQAQHYAVFVTELAPDEAGATEHLKALARERVDAVLVAASATTEMGRALQESLDKRPLVASGSIPGVECDVLMPDYREAGRLVGRHILRDGGGALYVHDPAVRGGAERLAGFQEICRERGSDPSACTAEIPAGARSSATRFDGLAERLQNARWIAASDDSLAIELMLRCQQMGRRPGQDVGIIGQGNDPIASRITPTLTSVDLSGDEIGARAMDLTLQRVTKTRQDAAQTTHVAPTLVERDSTRL